MWHYIFLSGLTGDTNPPPPHYSFIEKTQAESPYWKCLGPALCKHSILEVWKCLQILPVELPKMKT